MENRRYKVQRKNIYVGQVVESDRIYTVTKENAAFSTHKPGELDLASWVPLRTMLFTHDESEHANDLLYNSPHYPILNISADKEKLNEKGAFLIIKQEYNLDELLRYDGFSDILTYNNIVLIRKKFFTGRYAKDNSHLFGIKEMIPNDFKTEIDDETIRHSEYIQTLTLNSKRYFSYNQGKEIIPNELFYVLDELGNYSASEVLDKVAFNEDAFKPHEYEGKIKRLNLFR